MAADLPPIVERKMKPDGTVREYRCLAVHVDPGRFAIIRFDMQRGGALAAYDVTIPPGSTSYGYFWARRPYSIYRMLTPEGMVIAHRFDAVADVLIEKESIAYRDLVLDWWAFPDGRIVEEDGDELEELAGAGTVNAADRRRAEGAASQVVSRYRHIIDELTALERRHVFGKSHSAI